MLHLTPGPVPIPDFLCELFLNPSPHHRSPDFARTFAHVRLQLAELLGTKHWPTLLCTSGTGAMESTLCSSFHPGESVLVMETGHYGRLWTELANHHNLDVDTIQISSGASINPEVLHCALRAKKYSGVLLQSCETSTGALNDIKALASILKDYPDTCLLVDACSSLGAIEMKMDEWGVDAVIGSSQKALMSPSGLSFVSTSEKLRLRMTKKSPISYLDLNAEERVQKNMGLPRFTPNALAILALERVINFLNENNRWSLYRNRMQEISKHLTDLFSAFGIYPHPQSPCPTLSVFLLPHDFSSRQLRKSLYDKGVFLLGGFGAEEDRLLRIGHMGQITNDDLLSVSRALWQSLSEQSGKNDSSLSWTPQLSPALEQNPLWPIGRPKKL